MKNDLDLNRIKQMVQPFTELNPLRFWIDMLSSALLGWGFFFFAVFRDAGSLSQILALIPAAFLLYRGQIFIHEIVHFRGRMRGFETAYNWILGYPNNFPSYIYYPHAFHHGRSTFGTEQDPEYLPMMETSPGALFAKPVVLSFLLPIFQFARFSLLPLLSPFLSQEKKWWIFERMSTLALNPAYKRPLRVESEIDVMVHEDLKCALTTWTVVAMIVFGWLPVQIISLWTFVIFFASLMNMIRSKLNHRYDQEFSVRTPAEQLRDSVSIDGSWLNELWAPLGLTYHSIHHLASAIPYYNLKKAHQYLMQTLEVDHPYRKTILSTPEQAVRQLVEVGSMKRSHESSS